jgi:hypothetical protein
LTGPTSTTAARPAETKPTQLVETKPAENRPEAVTQAPDTFVGKTVEPPALSEETSDSIPW